jgi:hypothetical protein
MRVVYEMVSLRERVVELMDGLLNRGHHRTCLSSTQVGDYLPLGKLAQNKEGTRVEEIEVDNLKSITPNEVLIESTPST